jgi:hypothetical protein
MFFIYYYNVFVMRKVSVCVIVNAFIYVEMVHYFNIEKSFIILSFIFLILARFRKHF